MQRSLIALMKGDLLESFTLYPPLIFTLALVFYFALHLFIGFNQGAKILKWLFILNASVVTVNYIIKTIYSLY